MISAIRAIITGFRSKKGKPARFSATGRSGETFTDREVQQHYGLATSLPEGAEAILIKSGQNVYLIASDDRRYRIDLADSEVALYDKWGSIVHLQEGGKIVIECENEVLVKANKTVIESGEIHLGPEVATALGGGVLCQNHPNPVTGAPHPIGSSIVKGAL